MPSMFTTGDGSSSTSVGVGWGVPVARVAVKVRSGWIVIGSTNTTSARRLITKKPSTISAMDKPLDLMDPWSSLI